MISGEVENGRSKMGGRWAGENDRGCARATHPILAKMAKMSAIPR